MDRPRLSDLTPTELMTRAREYRLMATTARTAKVRDALNRLAIRFAILAAQVVVDTRRKK
jgi:hypothetical protein